MDKEPKISTEPADAPLNRREFLKSAALVGAAGTLSACAGSEWMPSIFSGKSDLHPYALNDPENIIYSVCLNCHVRCSMKTKFQDHTLVKVDGNPYDAKHLLPNVPFETKIAEAAQVDGHFCPKGQAGVQTYYDPYRIKEPLKRVGPRGSNEWKTISFDQAIQEIVDGGDLFGEGPVSGLKDILALRNPEVSAAMAQDVEALRQGDLTVGQFKERHRDYLAMLIDPEHPDLGPKNNQFCFMAGRIQHGRVAFSKRWFMNAVGSINWMDHTSICGQSHWIASKRTTWNSELKKGIPLMKPDFLNSEFVIFWGTGAFEANFGCTAIAELVQNAVEAGTLKYAVIDPRLSKTAAKAWKWVPIKPGQDLTLALGMTRWIIDQKRYDQGYLENANMDAAQQDGEPTCSDATHLIRLDTLKFLKPNEIGLESEGRVVMTDRGPQPAESAEHGLLEVDQTLKGIPVKSVFTLLAEAAREKSLEDYAKLAGVPAEIIESLAIEFTRHGKKAAIDRYRGAGQHTNGFYAEKAILNLNILIGNQDWMGGLSKGGGFYNQNGTRSHQPYNLIKDLHPQAMKPFGTTITREKASYEQSTLFAKNGYPAKRPWYPLSQDLYHEIIPSAAEGYPYPLKCLWLHKGTPAYASPGGGEFIKILRDPNIIPLFIADDVVLGETTVFADYVFPDLTFFERWGAPFGNPQPSIKSSPIRQPAAPPFTKEVEVFGEKMPISMESMMLAWAERLDLSGFGKNGFGPNSDFKRPEDFYLKLVANIAMDDEPVPDADPEEMKIFLQARRHLPSSVFDMEHWKRAVSPELWPKVVYLLNRGGRFSNFLDSYEKGQMRHRYNKQIHLYVEDLGGSRHSITGKTYSGVPRFEPQCHMDGTPVDFDNPDYPLTLLTFKTITGGQSRTISQTWSMEAIEPGNPIWIHRRDAESRGLKEGDRVRVVSPTNPEGVWDLQPYAPALPVEGSIKITEGLRPGTLAVSFHQGHWAYGARTVFIDGTPVPGDPRRARGICPNVVMLLDKYNRYTCLTDPIGGSSSFSDTPVNILKV